MAGFGNNQWLSTCTGAEVHILPDGSFSFRLCEISLKKQALSIDRKWEEKGHTSQLSTKIPKDKPLALTLSGKGILTKKTSSDEHLGPDKILRLFPNIKPDQFYIQNFISGKSSYISLVRKEILDEIISAIQKAGVEILLVSLGPFAVSHIIKQLNFYGNEARFDGHAITLSGDGEWEEYSYSPAVKSEFTLKIDIEPIDEKFLLAYAAAFQLLLYHKINAVELPVECVENTLAQFEQKQKFNFRLGLVLGVFFVLLLLNFMLFSYYSAKNNALLAQVNQDSSSVESYQQTESNIAQQLKQLTDLGWHKGISDAWLADQIAQSIPAGINLKELAINPLNTIESNRQRREIYKICTIQISGESKDLEPVNEWIYALKGKGWVRRVNLDSFAPSTDNDTQQFAITLNF